MHIALEVEHDDHVQQYKSQLVKNQQKEDCYLCKVYTYQVHKLMFWLIMSVDESEKLVISSPTICDIVPHATSLATGAQIQCTYM